MNDSIKKVLLLTNSLMQYNVYTLNIVAKKCDLTVLY